MSTRRFGMKSRLQDLQEECRKKKRNASTYVARAVHLAWMLVRWIDVFVISIPSSLILELTEGDSAELSAELENCKTCVTELRPVERIAARWYEERMHEAKQRHAEETSVFIKVSRKDLDTLIKDVRKCKCY